ncbi:MAG: HAMP domain-containing sensor histidine kinase, partial [Pseudomonadota bacterium]
MTEQMTTASERLRRVFNRRYAIALGLLAAAACASFGLTYRMSMIDTNRTIAFNLVSAQRTDSQRIAFLLTSLEKDPKSVVVEELAEELRMTIDRMRTNHDILVGASAESERISRFIAPLQAIYESGETEFDTRVRMFLENASIMSRIPPDSVEWEEAALARRDVISAARDTILQTHGLMSLILEAQAIRMNGVEKAMGIVAWVLTLALLGLITLLIFRPMIQHVLTAIREMEEAQSAAGEAEQAANEAKEAKGHFFQAASHELKTPLNAIVGMTDAIKDKGELGVEVELEQIISASDQLLNLLNNILDTHRLSDGHLALDKREFALRDIVERPLKRIQALAEAKGLAFHTDINIDQDLVVEGDAQRLEQVVTNLADNAVKFTTEGEVFVDAKMVDPGQGAGPEFCMSVRDTGVGMPPEQLAVLFERTVEQGSILARNGGLGVGLALVRAIASSMGGSVDVQSSEGEGSTFSVSIPLSQVSNPEAAHEPPAEATTDTEAGAEAPQKSAEGES